MVIGGWLVKASKTESANGKGREWRGTKGTIRWWCLRSWRKVSRILFVVIKMFRWSVVINVELCTVVIIQGYSCRRNVARNYAWCNYAYLLRNYML